jgi:hypothetical protein
MSVYIVTTIVTTSVIVEQELLTIPKHLSSSPGAQSLISREMFYRSLFVLLSFFFGHYIFCPSKYGLWLPLVIFRLFCTVTTYTNDMLTLYRYLVSLSAVLMVINVGGPFACCPIFFSFPIFCLSALLLVVEYLDIIFHIWPTVR